MFSSQEQVKVTSLGSCLQIGSSVLNIWFLCYHRRRKDRHEASGFSRRPDPDSDEDEDYERERRKRSKAWNINVKSRFKRDDILLFTFHVQLDK